MTSRKGSHYLPSTGFLVCPPRPLRDAGGMEDRCSQPHSALCTQSERQLASSALGWSRQGGAKQAFMTAMFQPGFWNTRQTTRVPPPLLQLSRIPICPRLRSVPVMSSFLECLPPRRDCQVDHDNDDFLVPHHIRSAHPQALVEGWVVGIWHLQVFLWAPNSDSSNSLPSGL